MNENFFKTMQKIDLIAEAIGTPSEVFAPLTALVAAAGSFLTIVEAGRLKKNDLLPLIIPEENGQLELDGKLRLPVKNIGQAVAKNLRLSIRGVEVLNKRCLEIGEKKILKIKFNTKLMAAILSQNPALIEARLSYQDAYRRSFETLGMEFSLKGGIYFLNKENWKFSQQPNHRPDSSGK
ncbi:MAG: hypothetical protein JW991_02425 [Candidatus Pacebacteria bacterium]|nr:hypothetical protein [Candidatus Paceibacterota bacterium]